MYLTILVHMYLSRAASARVWAPSAPAPTVGLAKAGAGWLEERRLLLYNLPATGCLAKVGCLTCRGWLQLTDTAAQIG